MSTFFALRSVGLAILLTAGFSTAEETIAPAAPRVKDVKAPRFELGVTVAPVRVTIDGVTQSGCQISAVAPDGPAAESGLLVGDIIAAVNGAPTAAPRTFGPGSKRAT